MSTAHEEGSSTQKRKASKACEQCSRRKTRCDQMRPWCSACSARNLSCTFSQKRKPGPPKGYKRNAPAPQANSSATPLSNESFPAVETGDVGDCLDVLLEHPGHAPEALTQHTSDAQPYEAVLGQDAWLEGFMTEELWNLPYALFDEDCQVAPIIQQPQPPGLSVDVRHQLLNAYLTLSSPLLPTFPKSKLTHLFHASPEHMAVDAVCAVSAGFATFTGIDHQDALDAAPGLVTRASSCLDKGMHNQASSEVSLDDVKVSLLLAIYATYCGTSDDSDARLRKTVQLAYNFGLDKVDSESRTQPQSLTNDEKEDCRRLWWSIYELDGFCAWRYSRPPLVDPLKTSSTSLPSSVFKDLMQPTATLGRLKAFPTEASQALVEAERSSMNSEQVYMACVTVARETFSHLTELPGDGEAMTVQLPLLEDSIASFRLVLPDDLRCMARASIWSPQDDRDHRYLGEGLLVLEMATICIQMVKCALNSRSSITSESDLREFWDKCLIAAFSILDVLRDFPPKIIQTLNPPTSGIIYIAVACVMLESKLDNDLKRCRRLAHRILLGRRALARMAQVWTVAKVFEDRIAALEISIAAVKSLDDVQNVLELWTGYGSVTDGMTETFFTFPFAQPRPWIVTMETTP